jgi:hypothetical protein
MAVPDSQEPSIIDALEAYLDSRLLDVHVCLPGRLKSYDTATQKGDVQVCVRRLVQDEDGTRVFETFPIIYDVPVDQMQTANHFISFPIAAGDFVWVHFVEQSIDAWLSNGGVNVQDPIKRRFDLRDCYATLARNPTSPVAEAESDSLVIGGKGSRPRAYFKDTDISLGSKTPTSFVALAQKVDQELQKIQTTISTFIPGSGGASFPNPYVFASTAATKVKAE